MWTAHLMLTFYWTFIRNYELNLSKVNPKKSAWVLYRFIFWAFGATKVTFLCPPSLCRCQCPQSPACSYSGIVFFCVTKHHTQLLMVFETFPPFARSHQGDANLSSVWTVARFWFLVFLIKLVKRKKKKREDGSLSLVVVTLIHLLSSQRLNNFFCDSALGPLKQTTRSAADGRRPI